MPEAADVAALAVGDDDIVVGVSASGRTPYVVSAIEAARRAGARDGLRRLRTRVGARGARRPSGRRGRRPGVPRRVDPTQGGNRAEARLEHALDRLDDPARQDLRQPHGRRLGDEREAAGARQTHRRKPRPAPRRSRSSTRSRRRTATPRSPSSRSSHRSIPPRPARSSTRPDRTFDWRWKREARSRSRAGRRPASSEATSRWPTGAWPVTGWRHRTGAASPCRASSISR